MKGVNPDLQGGMDGVGTEQQQQNQPTLSPEEEAAAREARRALLRVWMAKHGWATEGADTGENSVPASAAAVPHVPNVAEIAAASGVNVDEVYTMLTEEVAAGGDPAAVAAAAEALKQPLSLAEEMALLAARAAGIQARGRTGPQPAGGRLGKKGKGKKGGGAAKDTAAGEVVPEQVGGAPEAPVEGGRHHRRRRKNKGKGEAGGDISAPQGDLEVRGSGDEQGSGSGPGDSDDDDEEEEESTSEDWQTSEEDTPEEWVTATESEDSVSSAEGSESSSGSEGSEPHQRRRHRHPRGKVEVPVMEYEDRVIGGRVVHVLKPHQHKPKPYTFFAPVCPPGCLELTLCTVALF